MGKFFMSKITRFRNRLRKFVKCKYETSQYQGFHNFLETHGEKRKIMKFRTSEKFSKLSYLKSAKVHNQEVSTWKKQQWHRPSSI